MNTFKNKLYLTTFVLLFEIIESGCQTSIKKANDSTDKKKMQIQSPMQKDFGFTGSIVDLSYFQSVLKTTSVNDKKEIASEFYPLVFNKSIDIKNLKSYILEPTSENNLLNTQESHYKDAFDHEIILLDANNLKGILIKLYAPADLIPKFECNELINEKKSTDSATQILDKIFNCLPQLSKFTDKYYEKLKDTVTKLERIALNKFLRLNWLGGRGYENPHFLIKRSLDYGGSLNPYTHNLNLAWIKDNMVTIITLCTPKFGSYHGTEDDYIDKIEAYQKGKKKYPILRCLITTVEEAKKNNFINIYNFLSYKNPLQSQSTNDY